MKRALFMTLLSILTSVAVAQNGELPREWVDPDTGHRVVRLSDEAGSQSFYFHQNGHTASGDKLVFSTPKGLSTYNFKTKRIRADRRRPGGKRHRRAQDAEGLLL